MPNANQQDPYDDLAGVDLAALDLDHIDDPSEQRPTAWGRWLSAGFLTVLGALILYFPSTEYYVRYGQGNGMFFAVCMAGIVVGGLLGRLVLRWAQETAHEWAQEAARQPPKPVEEDKPASPLTRYSILTLVLVCGGILLFALPQSFYDVRGGSFDGLWFAASTAAFIVGILAGRWLLMQAVARAALDTTPAKPIVIPPWVKWVTLALLGTLALVAMFGMSLFGGNGDDSSLEFALGAIGFVVGVGGAVWMARRFDELETEAAKKRAKPRSDLQTRP